MAFSMLYGIFSLMIFLHVQQATIATRSEGYGRYRHGSYTSPAIPIIPSQWNLCALCWAKKDWHCIIKFCQRGFRRYWHDSDATSAIPFNPIVNILCHKCMKLQDWHCVRKVCQRVFGFGGYGGYDGYYGGYGGYTGGYGGYTGGYGGYSGLYPYTRKERCYYC